MTDYVHGSSKKEQSRLTRMQSLLNEGHVAALDLEGVMSLVDFGAGLGQLTRALARRLSSGARAVGIERDPQQIAEARRQAAEAGEDTLVEFRQGAADDPPLTDAERGTFDMAHARFLLEHLTDPGAAVRAMVDAVRPGGRIVLVDDDHEELRLHPDSPEFMTLWQAYAADYTRRGCDPAIGRRLPGHLAAAGARVLRTTTIHYGASRGETHFDMTVDNLVQVMDTARPGMVAAGSIDDATWDASLEAIEAWRARPDATVWYAIPLVEGVRA